MNQEWKEKWVKALRSGEYEQGTHDFRKGTNCYCVMGVLYDLYAPSEWVQNHHSIPSWTNMAASSARTVLKLSYNMAGILIQMNDRGSTFEELADYIEQNL